MPDIVENLKLPLKDYDSEALDAELKAQFGEIVAGISFTEGEDYIIAHLTQTSPALRNQVMLAYGAHDVSKLPPKVKPKTVEERLAAIEARLDRLDGGAIEAQITPKH